MCNTNLQLDLCQYKGQHHEDCTSPSQSHSCRSRSRSKPTNNSSNSVDKVWKDTQQLMDDCEHLVRIMTHVCSQQFSGAYRTLARYSQGCWRGCSAESADGGRNSHQYVHPPANCSSLPSSSSHCRSCCVLYPSSCTSSSNSACQQMSTSTICYCKSCACSCACCGSSESCGTCTIPHHLKKQQHRHHLQQEESLASSLESACTTCTSCSRRRGGWATRYRWRWSRSQSAQCLSSSSQICYSCCCSCSVMANGKDDSGGGNCTLVGVPSPQPPQTASTCSNCSTTISATRNCTCNGSSTVITNVTTSTDLAAHHHLCQCPSAHRPCPGGNTTLATNAQPSCSATEARLRSNVHRPCPSPRAQISSFSNARSTAATSSPKPRSGAPAHPSLLTILLLLVVTLARFTEGCSSRSTPKPRPASPTMRPNITFQTFSCPPAYAAWYCLNGATCFTVKIGESILYNCECADGYMGQRCEFKDLDGSYLQAREKVLMETASIAGGATVACVLVFIVMFAVYIVMQKDKEKRCRDIDDDGGGGRRNTDRQPFSGYQNPRPEIFRTISNPYARTIDELSHVEVESPEHDNRNTSGPSGSSGGGHPNQQSFQHQASPPPTS